MFQNVDIQWHISPEDGMTDFDEITDDEGLDERDGPGGTPDRTSHIPANLGKYGSPPEQFGSRSLGTIIGRHTPRPKSMDPQSNERDTLNNNNNLNNKQFTSTGEFYNDSRRTATSDWSGSSRSENSSDSPAPYRIKNMPPPPPPQQQGRPRQTFCK